MVEINSPNDFYSLVVDLFKTTPKDSCDHPTKNSNSDTYDNGDENMIVVNNEDINSNNSTFMTPD